MPKTCFFGLELKEYSLLVLKKSGGTRNQARDICKAIALCSVLFPGHMTDLFYSWRFVLVINLYSLSILLRNIGTLAELAVGVGESSCVI